MNRQELIKEAKNQRTQYMNKLSHNKGLTRLKKQQLQEVITDLRKINKALKDEDDDLEIRNLKDDQDELKHEGVLLEKEIKIIDGENEILELEYSEMANNQEEDEDEEEKENETPKQRENNLQQPRRKIRINEIIESIKTSNDEDEEDDEEDEEEDEEDEEEDEEDEEEDEEDDEEYEKPKKKTSRKMKRGEIKIQSEDEEDDDDMADDMETYRRNSKVQYTKQEGKKILSEILEDFEELIKIQIAEIKKYKKMDLLTEDTIEEIIDYHNQLRERADDQMVHTIQHLVKGDHLPDNFTSRINDKFQKIRNQLEVVIS